MKKFVTEFKEFITKGNALDLAIGVKPLFKLWKHNSRDT